MINKVNTGQSINTNYNFDTQKKITTEEEKKIERKDIIDFSRDTKTVDSSTKNQKLSSTDIEALKKQVDKATENLRSLVEKLILRQSKKSDKTSDAKTIAEAQQAVSEDGEYGVKAVSDRIANFAIAACGGDKTKLSEMRIAIGKGFEAAKKAFGGELPDICSQTYDEVMRKLDEWEKGDMTETAE